MGRRQGSNQHALSIRDARNGRGLDGLGSAVRGRMLEFLAQYGGIDTELLRDLVRYLVSRNTAWNPLNMRQQEVDRLHFAFGRAHGKLHLRALDQVIEIFWR